MVYFFGVVLCGVVWCIVAVWCCVELCGVLVVCGEIWFGVVWCGAVRYGMDTIVVTWLGWEVVCVSEWMTM